MAESFLKGQKTLWAKEKLLVTSNFSFFHSVFKRRILQTSKNKDLKTGGRWFRGLMIVIATGFIPPSSISIVVIWERSQWLGKNIERSTGFFLCFFFFSKSRKHGWVHWLLRHNWNNVENIVTHHAINQSVNQVRWRKVFVYISWRNPRRGDTFRICINRFPNDRF